MALRITQHYLEFAHDRIADADNEIRVTGQYLQVAGSAPKDNEIRVTGQYMQAAASQPLDNEVRVTGQYVSVAGSTPHDNGLQLVAQLVQILTVFSVEPIPVEDTLACSDAVTYEVIRGPIIDTVACSDSVTLQRSRTNLSITDVVACTDLAEIGIFFRSITDVIACTDKVKVRTGLDVDHFIACTDTVAFTRPIINISITDVLACTDLVGRQQDLAVTDFATCTDSVAVSKARVRSVTDTVSCSDSVSVEFVKTVTDTVACTDSVEVERVFGIVDLCSISDSVAVSVVYTKFVTDPCAYIVIDPNTLELTPVGLHDEFTYELDRTLNITDFVACTEFVRLEHCKASAIAYSITDTVVCTDVARTVLAFDITDNVVCTDEVRLLGNHIIDTVSCSDTVQRQVIRNAPLLIEDQLACSDGVGYTLIRSNTACYFDPFVGADEPDCPAPPQTLPVRQLVPECVRFQLHYPPVNPQTVININRRPDFGNLERVSYQRINRLTRAGKLIIFRDKGCWGDPIQTLAFSFSSLCEREAYGILCFMETYAAEEIGLLDHEHQYWTGIITDPNSPLVQDGRGRFSIGFEFEGKQSDITHSGVTLNAICEACQCS